MLNSKFPARGSKFFFLGVRDPNAYPYGTYIALEILQEGSGPHLPCLNPPMVFKEYREDIK